MMDELMEGEKKKENFPAIVLILVNRRTKRTIF